jgi:serine/threonine protein phosphatase PrpC
VSKEEIARAVSPEKDLPAACTELIDLANERGGPDNITVIVVRCSGGALRDATREELEGHGAGPPVNGQASTQPVPAFEQRPPEAPDGVRLVAITAAAALIVALALLVSGSVF